MLVEWRKKIEAESLSTKKSDTLDALRSLKALLTGGAPVDDHLAKFFESKGVKLLQSEGMTECSGSLFTGHPIDTSYLTLSMHPSIIYEWIPIDSDLLVGMDEEKERKENEKEREGEEFMGGELVIVDSPAVTKGYLNNEAANQRAFFWAPPAGMPDHPAVRKFRTGDVFKILPGSGGRCVEYVCRVDDVLSLSTGEKMNPIEFEQRMRQRTWLELDTQQKATVQLVNNICLLGRNMPLPFAVIEPDYKAVDEAYASSLIKDKDVTVWLRDILWQAVASVNEGWSSSCRVHREAVIILQRDEEPLKISRKRQVYRTIAEARFSAEMRKRCDRILGNQQQPKEDSSKNHNRLGLVRIIFESLADVLAVPVDTLLGDESTPTQPFAALGVTSLLASQLASRLSDRLNIAVPVSALYTYPTVTQMASFLQQGHSDNNHNTTPTTVTRNYKDEGIAVIGMSMRFPGGGEEGGGYWEVLRDGVDAITEVPPSRWDTDALYSPDSDAPAAIHSRKGGFVEDTEYFDHTFFGISAKEALMMDPRQKVNTGDYSTYIIYMYVDGIEVGMGGVGGSRYTPSVASWFQHRSFHCCHGCSFPRTRNQPFRIKCLYTIWHRRYSISLQPCYSIHSFIKI